MTPSIGGCHPAVPQYKSVAASSESKEPCHEWLLPDELIPALEENLFQAKNLSIDNLGLCLCNKINHLLEHGEASWGKSHFLEIPSCLTKSWWPLSSQKPSFIPQAWVTIAPDGKAVDVQIIVDGEPLGKGEFKIWRKSESFHIVFGDSPEIFYAQTAAGSIRLADYDQIIKGYGIQDEARRYLEERNLKEEASLIAPTPQVHVDGEKICLEDFRYADSLRSVINTKMLSGQPVTRNNMIWLFLQLARLLQALPPYSHNDVKPENIWVVIDKEGRPSPLLADWDVANKCDTFLGHGYKYRYWDCLAQKFSMASAFTDLWSFWFLVGEYLESQDGERTDVLNKAPQAFCTGFSMARREISLQPVEELSRFVASLDMDTFLKSAGRLTCPEVVSLRANEAPNIDDFHTALDAAATAQPEKFKNIRDKVKGDHRLLSRVLQIWKANAKEADVVFGPTKMYYGDVMYNKELRRIVEQCPQAWDRTIAHLQRLYDGRESPVPRELLFPEEPASSRQGDQQYGDVGGRHAHKA